MNDRGEQTGQSDGTSKAVAQRGVLTSIAFIIFWLAMGVTLITLFASHWWLADLLTHFRVQMVLAMLPAIIFFLVRGRWLTAVVSLALLMFLVTPMLPYVFSRPISKGRYLPESYRLMTYNVLTSNQSYENTVRFIREEKPDFVVLVEVDQAWANELSVLKSEFPFIKFHDRTDNFGVALLSRIPWKDCSIVSMGRDRLPAINATFELESAENGSEPKRLQIMGVHPIPPMRRHTAENRNKYLIDASESLLQDHARIMTGDFNLSPWSPWFAKINEAGNTRDAARDVGIRGLVPTWHVFPTVMGGIKIDHALVSPDISVGEYRVSENLGSDHRAIVVGFQFNLD